MSASPLDIYSRRVKEGALKGDAAQAKAAQSLQRLYNDLLKKSPRFAFWRKQAETRGIYMYGGVGRGKSMLMDMFYAALPNTITKRRVHC